MRLHCLGTAGYHPSETRHTSCYFLPESGIVLDAGTGLFRLPPLIQTDSLDILLSHAHLDHTVGLTFLLDVVYQRPVREIRVWGQQEKLDAIRQLIGSELIFPVELPVRWMAIDDQPEFCVRPITRAAGDGRQNQPDQTLASSAGMPPVRVQWHFQSHPGGSVGYRLDWDTDPTDNPTQTRQAGQGRAFSPSTPPKSLVYVTDTTGADPARPATYNWMAGTDLLMHECNFSTAHRQWAEKTGHCWLGRVAEIAHASKPERVLLTHLNPIAELDLPVVESVFRSPVDVAADGMCLDF